MTYAEHIDELCAQYGVRHTHEVRRVDYSSSYRDSRTIDTPPVRTELTYFVALHELGHIVLDHEGAFSITRRTLQKEGQAWQWAFEHALHEPSPDTAEKGLGYLLTYWEARPRDIRRSPSEYAHARNYLTARTRSTKPKQLALAV